jgi:hypothetical protein
MFYFNKYYHLIVMLPKSTIALGAGVLIGFGVVFALISLNNTSGDSLIDFLKSFDVMGVLQHALPFI